MNNRIKSLALLVNLGIYGAAFPLSAAETASDSKAAEPAGPRRFNHYRGRNS